LPAAIVAADVAGYSRLMRIDEASTLAALRRHRAELIDPVMPEHAGRIVKTMGDGPLMEFPSVVDAMAFAADVQHLGAGRTLR
jgi:adenylate cyclase